MSIKERSSFIIAIHVKKEKVKGMERNALRLGLYMSGVITLGKEEQKPTLLPKDFTTPRVLLS